MTRKPRKTRSARGQAARRKARKHPRRGSGPVRARRDALDDFIDAAARSLSLPAEAAWKPAIKANLQVTLQFAATVAEFSLPDEAEPAPLFRA